MNKLPLKDILAAFDMGAKEVWDELLQTMKENKLAFILE